MKIDDENVFTILTSQERSMEYYSLLQQMKN